MTNERLKAIARELLMQVCDQAGSDEKACELLVERMGLTAEEIYELLGIEMV